MVQGPVGGEGCSDSQFTTGGPRLVLAVSHTPASWLLQLFCTLQDQCVNRVLAPGQVKTSLVVAGLSSGGSGCLCPAAVGDGRSVREVRAGGSCCGRLDDEVS